MDSIISLAQNYYNQVMLAIVVLLIGLALGLLAQKFLHRFLKDLGMNNAFSKLGFSSDVERSTGTLVSYIIYLATLWYFLTLLGIGSLVVYLLVGIIIVMIILSLALGIKDIIPNLQGRLELKRQNLHVGKEVKLDYVRGGILHVGLFTTTIQTPKKDILYVPNALFRK